MRAAGSEKVRVGRGIKFDVDAACKLVYLTMPRVNFVYPPYSWDPQDLMNQDPFNVSRMAFSIMICRNQLPNFRLPIAIPPSPGDTEQVSSRLSLELV
jgi:hypothetical protein